MVTPGLLVDVGYECRSFHLDDIAAGRKIDERAWAAERMACFYADEMFDPGGLMLADAAGLWRPSWTTRPCGTPRLACRETASIVRKRYGPCTAAALLAAVPQDVKAEGSSVQSFACTPSTGAGVADGFAWARLTAPNVDPLIVFFNVVPDVQPGQPTVASWQVISYGSAIVCEDSMPVEACNLLPGIPRR